jgi:hypothetical protein
MKQKIYIETSIPSFYHDDRVDAEIAARRKWTREMPNNPVGDALHLALASYHKCDFFLTWNCKHLANANKFYHIRRVNTILDLYVPLLVTPLELRGDEENDTR